MDIKAITKTVVSNAFGISASYTAKRIMEANLPEPENKLQQAEMYLGAMGIGAMVNKAVTDYVNVAVDEAWTAGETLKNSIQEIKSLKN